MLSNHRSTKYFFILFFFLIFATSDVFAALSQTYQLESTAYQECVIDRDSTNGNTQNSGNGQATCTQLAGLAPSYSHTYHHSIQSPPRLTYKHYFYNESCPSTTPLNLETGQCEATIPTCDSIGFNTAGSYIGGFCVIDNSGILQPSVTQCLSNDQSTVNIPTCTQTQCPDGSLIDPQLGQECPVNRLCWDGSFVSPNQSCPTPPFICPDGSQAATQQQCPSPDFQEHTCWNGSTIPLNSACPIKTGVLCSDGSTASGSVNCPTSTTMSTVCDDGTQVQDHSSCAAPNITNNNIKDTATSITTSTSTTTNNTNSTVETTTTTSTTNIDMDLNSVNSRLDKINNSIENLSKSSKGNGGSIYSKSGKTFGGATAAFMTAMGDSALMQSVSDVFNITVTQNTCPFWTLPAVMGLNSYVIDHHCQPFMDNVFLVISSVLLLVATMTSIRIMLAG